MNTPRTTSPRRRYNEVMEQLCKTPLWAALEDAGRESADVCKDCRDRSCTRCQQ